MNTKNMWSAMVVVLLIATVIPLHGAQKTKPRATPAPSATSGAITNGDVPPGNAMALSIPQARTMLKEAIKNRFVGSVTLWVVTIVTSPATDVRARTSGIDLAAPTTVDGKPFDGKVSIKFKEVRDYLAPYPIKMVRSYSVGTLPKPDSSTLFDWRCYRWTDGTAAQSFADAYNRLAYAAYHQDEDFAKEFETFSVAAKAWRENPTKPPLGPDADRERILAENAIKEKNVDAAIGHYEGALQAQATWPAGWFNLAVIYSEQEDYGYAANRMKHYLELAPDASDAKDARAQMVIWEDKAGQ
jgi:hypothetical protein